jgi:hypothetical protein
VHPLHQDPLLHYRQIAADVDGSLLRDDCVGGAGMCRAAQRCDGKK